MRKRNSIFLLLLVPFFYFARCQKEDNCKRKLWFTNSSPDVVVSAELMETGDGKFKLSGPFLDSGRVSGTCVGEMENNTDRKDLFIIDSASYAMNTGKTFQRDSILIKLKVHKQFSMTLAEMRAVDFHISYP